MTHFILPTTLSVTELLENNPPIDIAKPKDEIMKFIITVIINLWVMGEKYKDDDGYVPLSAKILQTITYDYKKYLLYLENQGIIESKGSSYQTGISCRKYRLIFPFEDTCSERITDQWLLNRISVSKKTNFKNGSDAPKYLSKWFNRKLKIDDEKAINYVDRDLFENQKRHKIAIQKIVVGDFVIKRDTNGKRVHSNLSLIKSGLRDYLRYDSKQLVGLDLKSAQPILIASLLLNPDFYVIDDDSNESLGSYWVDLGDMSSLYILSLQSLILSYTDSSSLSYLSYSYPLSSPSISFLYYVTEIRKEIMPRLNAPDVIRFKEIVSKYDIYDYLIDKFPSIKKCKPEEQRSKAKEVLYEIMYSKSHSKSKMKSDFETEFPNVMHILNLYKLKSSHSPWYNSNKPHAALAVMLQYIESHIFIDNICKRLSSQYPELPIFTIHDNIMTIKGEEDKAKKIIEDIIQEMIGVMPIVRVE